MNDAIDPSAQARATGIGTEYVDNSGGAGRFLPQRILVIAQGQTGVTYSTTKFQVTGGPKQVGQTAGYISPAYGIVRELYPKNGGGVGSIPVEVCLLADGTTAATGDITPSASTVSKNTTCYVVIGGVKHKRFVIPKTTSVAATDISDWLESLRQSIENTLERLVTVAHEYGTPTSAAGGSNTGDGTMTQNAVAGAPKAGTFTLTCTAAATDAGTFSVVDPDGFTVGTVTVGGGSTEVAGLDITIADGSADFVVGDTFTIEVPSSKLNVTSGWKGSSANDLTIQMVCDYEDDITWAFTQPTGGAANPTVDAALAQVGSTRTTLVINALEIADTTALDAYQSWVGDPENRSGRWAPAVRKPAFVFTGNNAVTVDAATTVTSTRTTDLANVQINVPGSPNMPFAIAGAAGAKVASLANANPAHDYESIELPTITPGTDAQEWNADPEQANSRELAVQRGSSTVEFRDGVVRLVDVITMYAPTGEDPPPYRDVVDIVKLQNVLYRADLEFDSDRWKGKILISDSTPTRNPDARKPSSVHNAWNGIIDGLALDAIITNPAAAKKGKTVTITGPKRFDLDAPLQLSGNTNQRAIKVFWGFDFGASS